MIERRKFLPKGVNVVMAGFRCGVGRGEGGALLLTNLARFFRGPQIQMIAVKAGIPRPWAASATNLAMIIVVMILAIQRRQPPSR